MLSEFLPRRNGSISGLLSCLLYRSQEEPDPGRPATRPFIPFGYIAVRRRLWQPEPGPQPRDVRFIPVSGQDEQRLPVTAQAAGVLPGADLLAVLGQ